MIAHRRSTNLFITYHGPGSASLRQRKSKTTSQTSNLRKHTRSHLCQCSQPDIVPRKLLLLRSDSART